MTDRDALAAALRALENPLRFASRGDFEHLDRVKDLEETVTAAARRALDAAASPTARAVLEEIIDLVPPAGATRELRVEGLSRCLEKVESLTGGSREKTAATPRFVPSPTATRGVTPVALGDLKAGSHPVPEPSGGRDAPGAADLVDRSVEVTPTPEAEVAPALEQSPKPRRKKRAAGAVSLRPDSPVQYVKGVGPRYAASFGTRGIATVEDLLRFLPRRYEDRRGHQQIGDLTVGTIATVEGEVLTRTAKRMGRRRMLEVTIRDDSGGLVLTWFRVPARAYQERFARGTRVRVSGEVKRYRGKLQMVHPETTVVSAQLDFDAAQQGDGEPESQVQDSIVPIYLEVEGIRPAHLRRITAAALSACELIQDHLPREVLDHRDLPSLGDALAALHRPPPEADLVELDARRSRWHRRLIYEELFLLQLAVLQRKIRTREEPGRAVVLREPLVQAAAGLFDFTLTAAQARVLAELQADLEGDVAMNRLLQGDVGSGKTAIALTLAAAIAAAGEQTAFMVPTEILAEQHLRVAQKTLTPHGIRVALLTGSLSARERRSMLEGLATGVIHVVIGTHAIIQDDVRFKALALGIVDEQHRFGVMQRSRLVDLGRDSRGCLPHMLVMTATPIPRTLALTVYGDLDAAVLDELPPGRLAVKTQLFRERQRTQVYRRVLAAVQQGRQAYVVFPLVEESDKEGMDRLRDATGAAEELANGPLEGQRVGLLHGRMSADEKDAIMQRFEAGEIQVLVATTVIEVGIDVANATVMVIENAERFGLSQLHQLRGRVGRGEHQSECLLLAQYTASDDAWRRLTVMERTNDGFEIAEEDLEIRGHGDIIGTRQAGVPLFAVANLARDQAILTAARDDAAALLARDPTLEAPENAGLRSLLGEHWRQRLELARIG